MKRPYLLAAFCGLMLVSACTKQAETTSTETTSVPAEQLLDSKEAIAKHFEVRGDTISPEGAVSVAEVEQTLQKKDEGDFTVKGEVAAACQVKGCWMKVKMPSGKLMHVTFADYSFFVPKDVNGKEVVFKGHAYNDTLSVEELRHYAEDDGKSDAEIAAITKPEVTYLFNATGVLIPKADSAQKM